ncbi:hypothetical protein DW826_12065 [Clostridium sp. AM34-11AC]|nr:hypothetical protein DW826_12065 [Clostridium sp. AM34-11AC]RGE18350.1 hypothetical protein DXA87_01470 [Desulfotomaculum sp. OF05-3]
MDQLGKRTRRPGFGFGCWWISGAVPLGLQKNAKGGEKVTQLAALRQVSPFLQRIFLRAKRKPEPPQSGIRVRRQACAGGWMELGTLTGAGAGSDKKDRAGVSEPAGYIDRC